MSSTCVFCRIVAGEAPATVVAQTESLLAFRDTNPQAPTHVLVIPKAHHTDVAALISHDPALAAQLLNLASDLARREGIADSGYRLVFNTGAGAGQSVFHVHCHLLGGRAMSWPPG